MARGGYRPNSGPLKASKTPISKSAASSQINSATTPLAYMLAVMRDPDVDPLRRDRMAVAAAPFMHPRIYDHRVGKKEAERDKAHQAAAGSDWADELGSDPRAVN
jgi:hypothetical protein